ncbi:hypothetical protein D3C72_2302290 [compost metagenome]
MIRVVRLEIAKGDVLVQADRFYCRHVLQQREAAGGVVDGGGIGAAAGAIAIGQLVRTVTLGMEGAQFVAVPAAR